MLKIKFFGLNEKPNSIIDDGEIIELARLLRYYKKLSLFKSNNEKFPQLFVSDDFILGACDHLYYKNPLRWQKIISTIIFVISGRIPDKSDLKRFYDVILRIRKNFKDFPKILTVIDSPNFVFGAFPYFLIAFDFSARGWSCEGKNNPENLFYFIEKIIKSKNIDISTFLCAHREHRPVLSKNIDYQGLRKMINVVSGILENIPTEKKIRLEIFQPNGSESGLNAVFPEIFSSYLKNKSLGVLADKLQEHYKECGKYFRQLSKSRKLIVKLFPIDNHIQEVEKIVRKNFGKNWNKIDYSLLVKQVSLLQAGNINIKNLDAIATVSEFTLKSIKRLIPHYANFRKISKRLILYNLSKVRDPERKILISRSIRKFLNVETTESKAIQETAFYFLWGKAVKKNDQVILGFERDHDLYQTMAISYGYLGDESDVSKYRVPILYARRVDVARNDGISFRDISFRQFWRTSEKRTE